MRPSKFAVAAIPISMLVAGMLLASTTLLAQNPPAEPGRQVVKNKDHFGPIEDAVFSADSSRFFLWTNERKTWDADRKGTLWIWDIEKNKAVLSIKDYVDTPNDHAPGKPLIIHAPQPLLKDKQDFDAWRKDLKQRKELVRALPHPSPVIGAAFSPDGDQILVWSDDGTARLWNVRQPELLYSIPLTERIGGATLNGDATRAFVWAFPESCVWSLENGKLLQITIKSPSRCFRLIVLRGSSRSLKYSMIETTSAESMSSISI